MNVVNIQHSNSEWRWRAVQSQISEKFALCGKTGSKFSLNFLYQF